MKKYYFFDGAAQQGPFTLEELREKNITAQTSVWFDPMPQWKPAGEVDELKSIFNNTTTQQPVAPPAHPSKEEDWNNKQFYFVDGAGTRQGPFNLNQLQGKNITSNTSVWYDPLPKWTTAGEVPALKNIITATAAHPVAKEEDWNNKQFYFVDGAGVRQGPFNLNQLQGKNITSNTSVWYDPLPKWTTAGEVPALKNIITATAAHPVAKDEDWNNKQFYFVDGAGTRQGPFNLNQLQGKNITANTSVWYDPLPKWTTAGEVAALKNIITATAAHLVAKEEDWNNKQFYFVDGAGTRQGPFNLNQLQGKNITANTSVWYDPLPKWTTAGEVAALKNIITTTAAHPVAKEEDWNNKQYYFADSAKTQHGPFNLEQLKGKNIMSETPIWYPPLTKWTTAGEVAALKDIIDKPPAL